MVERHERDRHAWEHEALSVRSPIAVLNPNVINLSRPASAYLDCN
jgi:hypothetical protein